MSIIADNSEGIVVSSKENQYVKQVNVMLSTSSRIPFAYALDKKIGKISTSTDVSMKRIGNPLPHQRKVYKQAVNELLKRKYIFLSLCCGFGKTSMSCMMCAEYLKKPVFILTDRVLISQGWLKEISAFTDQEGTLVSTKEDLANSFCVGTYETCRKFSEEDLKRFGVLIIDEALCMCTQIRVSVVLKFAPTYIIGLCADLIRTDGLHCVLPYFFGPVKEFIRIISTKPFTVYKFNTKFKPRVEQQRWKKGVNWHVVTESIAENEERNKQIAILAEANANKKVLILCKRKEHCKKLAELLTAHHISVQVLVGTQRKYDNCKVLISTFSKSGKGFDDKNCCSAFDGQRINVLILAADTMNAEQQVGRIRDTNPVIYDIVDDFSSFRTHWRAREKWYKSRNGTIIEESL